MYPTPAAQRETRNGIQASQLLRFYKLGIVLATCYIAGTEKMTA